MTTFPPTHHPEIGERAVGTIISRRGDEKVVDVRSGIVLDIIDDLFLIRIDNGFWQAFTRAEVSRA